VCVCVFVIACAY